MVIDNSKGVEAWDMCIALSKAGLLTKPTHRNIIRLAPPLIINDEQMVGRAGSRGREGNNKNE